MKTRFPAVAGSFYPSSPRKLREVIGSCLEKERSRIAPPPANGIILGGVVPHAGYIYSGYHAVHFFETVRQSRQHFDTAVIVHPSHSGMGPVIALDDNEEWETPLGSVPLDLELAELVPFERSEPAHEQEHSGELMVPYLQYFLPEGLKIIPVIMNRQTPENARRIADEIFRASNRLNRSILFIASSDFCHFLSPEAGHDMDEHVIREILALNVEGVAEQVQRYRISVCGFGPIMALIEYSRLTGKSVVAKVLRRGHSGEFSPSRSVVDYVTLLFQAEEFL